MNSLDFWRLCSIFEKATLPNQTWFPWPVQLRPNSSEKRGEAAVEFGRAHVRYLYRQHALCERGFTLRPHKVKQTEMPILSKIPGKRKKSNEVWLASFKDILVSGTVSFPSILSRVCAPHTVGLGVSGAIEDIPPLLGWYAIVHRLLPFLSNASNKTSIHNSLQLDTHSKFLRWPLHQLSSTLRPLS